MFAFDTALEMLEHGEKRRAHIRFGDALMSEVNVTLLR